MSSHHNKWNEFNSKQSILKHVYKISFVSLTDKMFSERVQKFDHKPSSNTFLIIT